VTGENNNTNNTRLPFHAGAINGGKGANETLQDPVLGWKPTALAKAKRHGISKKKYLNHNSDR
jgi:hypothetical protein